MRSPESPMSFEAHESEKAYVEEILGHEGARALVRIAQEKIGKPIEDSDTDIDPGILGGRYAAARILLELPRMSQKNEDWLLDVISKEFRQFSGAPVLAVRRLASFRVISKNSTRDIFSEGPARTHYRDFLPSVEQGIRKIIRDDLKREELKGAAQEAGYYKLAFGEAFWSADENDAMVAALESRWRREGIVDSDEDGIPALRELALARVLKSTMVEGEEGIEFEEEFKSSND